jgi:hypothetical protein
MKPVTPLPWKIEIDIDAVDIVGADDANVACYANKNADYLVHAANAYPKLVAGLHAFLADAEMVLDALQATNGLGARATFAANEITARALLASLGEPYE